MTRTAGATHHVRRLAAVVDIVEETAASQRKSKRPAGTPAAPAGTAAAQTARPHRPSAPAAAAAAASRTAWTQARSAVVRPVTARRAPAAAAAAVATASRRYGSDVLGGRSDRDAGRTGAVDAAGQPRATAVIGGNSTHPLTLSRWQAVHERCLAKHRGGRDGRGLLAGHGADGGIAQLCGDCKRNDDGRRCRHRPYRDGAYVAGTGRGALTR